MKHSIGIDFGTTKTMVSYFNPATRQPQLVVLDPTRDRTSIPTTIHIDESGECLFGEDADEQIQYDPEGYCRAFKLHLGEAEPVLPRVDETAEGIATRFLRHVKEECEQTVFHGETIDTATITIPVQFSPARKESLKRAAEAAGFASVSFIPEPEAAGTAFLRDNPTDKFSRALVLDWGGGTLDIAIISRDESGAIHADRRCAEGRDDVGGEEMDQKLLYDVDALWIEQFGLKLLASEENEPKLLREAEKAKKELSKKDPGVFRQGTRKLEVTRTHFRELIGEMLESAVQIVHSALAKNKKRGNPDPDAILLIGGTSLCPAVRETMEKTFPNLRVLSWHRSHEAVALGCISASNESGNAKEKEEQLTTIINRVEQLILDLNTSKVTKVDADIIASAANQGQPRAKTLLGDIYHYGCDGYKENKRLSYEWWTAAADVGDDLGMANLAFLYLDDDGPVPRDIPKAVWLARKAVEKKRTINNLSILLFALAIKEADKDRKDPEIRRLANEILEQVENKSPDDFLAKDRVAIGLTCWILANNSFDDNKIAECLRRGAAFGNESCLEILESPPIDISVRSAVFSGLVLTITNTDSTPLLAHLVVRNDDPSTTDFEHDVMLPAYQDTELGWLEMVRNIAIGDTILIACQNYSFAKVVGVHGENDITVTSVNLNDNDDSED